MWPDLFILAHLAQGPAHGYEIKKHVERFLGPRAINNNVLYPALQRFAALDAIERVAAEADPGRPPRTVYRLTETGHDLLQALLREADPAVLADEHEFQARVAFFDRIEAPDRRRIIAVRRRIVESTLATLDGLRPEALARPWGLRVLDFHVERGRTELAWLDTLEAAAREHDNGRPD